MSAGSASSAASAGDPAQNALSGGVPKLRQLCEQIVEDDARIRDAIERDALDQATILDEAERILQEGSFDFESRLLELENAERVRSEVLTSKKDPWYVPVAIGVILLGFAGLIALLVVGILKWIGLLKGLPIWPFVVVPLALIVAGGYVVGRDDKVTALGVSQKSSATSLAELLRSTLSDQLRSLVLIPALEHVASPQFADPAVEQVSITDAPYLSSRVDAAGRIQTASYREVLTSLSRSGGATIGLAGTRGVGKSELLRTFCEEPTNRATMDAGGTIGIVVPAPVAYDSVTFLRVLIRRLAEKVPDYDPAAFQRRMRAASAEDVGLLIFSLVVAFAGAALVTGLTRSDRHALGWVLIAVGAVVVVLVTTFRFVLPSGIGPRLLEVLASLEGQKGPELQIGSVTVGRRKPEDDVAAGTRINKARRQRMATEATRLAQRVRYIETQSESLQASATFKSTGLAKTSGFSLEQVPLTEADLVLELTTFVAHLHAAGYQVRIGIDELDKLVDGQKAEDFLTGMKILFPIRECSFLLTISENASAQFARRGTPVRDVFDSSLDTVVIVQPLTFLEARRMVRSRLRAGPEEQMPDSQILLCHCLSGGLPRDYLRYCRQLGEVNGRMGSHNPLDGVAGQLLASELRLRLDGIRATLQGRDEGDAGATLVRELERVESAFGAGKTLELVGPFLASDPSFAALVCGQALPDTTSLGAAVREEDWIRETRRQLYCHLLFLDTVRDAFSSQPYWSNGQSDDRSDNRSDLLGMFDVLRDARHRLELDAAAGWRCAVEARRLLGLAPLPAPLGTGNGQGVSPAPRRRANRGVTGVSP